VGRETNSGPWVCIVSESPTKSASRRAGEELEKVIIQTTGGGNPSKEIREQLGIMNVHHAARFPDPEVATPPER
jgi:hypothetical protein